MSKLDLHYYDGKISHNELIDIEVERSSRISSEEKITAFNKLRDLIANKNNHSLSSYDTITRDFIIIGRGGSNYDNSNNLYACDLLYLCYEIIVIKGNNDLLDELTLQLIDMQSGICNPGRTTRLYQIVNAYL